MVLNDWKVWAVLAALFLVIFIITAVFLTRRTRLWASTQTHLQFVLKQLEQENNRTATLTQENQHLKDQLAEQERELIRAQSIYTAEKQAAAALHQQIKQNQETMSAQFQKLSQMALQQQTKNFQQSGQQSIEQLLKPLKSQIDAFQQRLNQVHSESIRSQTQLGSELRQIMDIGLQMSHEAQHLTQALKGDKKRMGTWGELLLSQTLEQMGLVKGRHFQAQPRYRDKQGRLHIPDFVVHLPGEKHLVIDCKTSLVDYDRAMATVDLKEQAKALDALVKAFERHVDDLASKNYQGLPQLQSPDFVLMFVPIEPAYLAALSHDSKLFEYGLRKNIIITSHTSLVAILRTVAQVWALAQSHENAHALAQQAGAIFNQLDLLAERMRRMGDSISQLTNHYNRSVTALVGQQGVYRKLEGFQSLTQQSHHEISLQTLHAQVHTHRFNVDDKSQNKQSKTQSLSKELSNTATNKGNKNT